MRPVHVFTASDIPVFVSPWFLLLLFWGYQIGATPQLGVLIVLCIALSLLVHEFGHALTARHYQLTPTILLHGFGGLCAHRPAPRDSQDALIIAAGPGAGLLFGLLALAVRQLSGSIGPGWPDDHPGIAFVLDVLVPINIYWSLLNLIPLWPLDGGQLFRLGMVRLLRPERARWVTHGLGMVLSAAVLLLGLQRGEIFLPLLGMLFLAQNYQAGRGQISSGPERRRRRSPTTSLLDRARACFAEGDYEECARICHQVRREPSLPAEVLKGVWPLLGMATARAGQPREAVAYLRRAAPTEEVARTWIECLLVTGQTEEAITLLRSEIFAKLPRSFRRELGDLLGQ